MAPGAEAGLTVRGRIELHYIATQAAPDAVVTFDNAYFHLRVTFDGVFADGFESVP